MAVRTNGPAGDGAAVDGIAAAPTIYDVARAAGVSIASVSRVLNGRRNPRPETAARVQQAVADLGFVPDSAARALSVKLKEVVGVIMRRPLTAGSMVPSPWAPACRPAPGKRRGCSATTPSPTRPSPCSSTT